MSRRDDRVSLLDMLIYAREAVLSPSVLCVVKQPGVLRQGVEIPPPHQPSPALRQAQGSARLLRLPLKGGVIGPFVGLRNRLVHGYYDVDLEILRSIIRSDLPPLIEQLESIVEE